MRAHAVVGSAIVLGLLLTFTELKAEEAGWIRLYDGWRYASISSVLETSDGGIVIAGANGITYAGDLDDAMIGKLDRSGNFVWKKIVGGHGSDVFTSVIETSNGDFLALGKTWAAGYHGDGIWLVRLSATGKILWNRSYKIDDYADSRRYSFPTAVTELPAGGFVLTTTKSLARLDEAGKVLWVRSYQDPSFSIQSIVRDDDGGYFVVGGNACARLDRNGTVVWMKVFESALFLKGGADAGDDGYFAVGSYIRDYVSRPVYMKLDGTGEIAWARYCAEERGLLKVVSTAETRNVLGGYVGTGYWTSRPWFLEIDDSGEICSQRIVWSDDEEGGSFDGIGTSQDGSVLLSGRIWTFGKGVGWDGLLLRLPPADGVITCPNLLRDSEAIAEPLSLTGTDGSKDSVLKKTVWRPIKSFQAGWDAAVVDPCQASM